MEFNFKFQAPPDNVRDWQIFVVTLRLIKHFEKNNNNKRPKHLQCDK